MPTDSIQRFMNRPIYILRLIYVIMCTQLLTYTLYAEKPDENRFRMVRVTPPATLNEPMVFEVAADGRIFIIERRGGIKMMAPDNQTVQMIGSLSVNNAARVGNGEQGLVGMTLHPRFVENGWIYLYYFHPTEEKGVISRWVIRDNVLVANSEIVMIEWLSQRETCCHTGGGMTWDKNNNLYITTGNNRGNNITSHTDERPGRQAWDDQGGTANSNSFEGKILRIHPEDDGSYTIPDGNLFKPGTAGTLPEIYTMGHRNAWRVSIDSQTGFIYWGEVGPDARQDTERGPKGYDEFNQARGPGFFGWPYFVGDSAYPEFDYASNSPGAYPDPLKPINDSPNNSGLKQLPPLQPSFVYYPYDTSEKFPELGSGGRSATGGPVYRQADFLTAERPWPAYFEGKWLASELSRRAIFLIGMDEDSQLTSVERFLPDFKPVEPIDMKFGPDGDLYVLEYGGRWFQASPDAKLTRIQYVAGNRKPVAMATADRLTGKPPFSVQLSAADSYDFDKDELSHEWSLIHPGGETTTVNGISPVISIEDEGAYIVWLTVTDLSGASDSQSLKVVSGNLPPEVAIRIQGNQSFYFPGSPVAYEVAVQDDEDGDLEEGNILPQHVTVSINYANDGFDIATFENLSPDDDDAARNPVAFSLMNKGNCKACHLPNARLVGPGFAEIAEKYQGNPDAMQFLTRKIITGGSGSWGQIPMPPNYTINESEAASILTYILSLTGRSASIHPVAGEVETDASLTNGSYILRAQYRDRGNNGVPSLASQAVSILKFPSLAPDQAAEQLHIDRSNFGATAKNGAFLKFSQVDLTGIQSASLAAFAMPFARHAGGSVEMRMDSIDGEVLGQVNIEVAAVERPQAPPRRAADEDADAPRPRRRQAGPPQQPAHMTIKPTQGLHDIYFVFKNPAANDLAPLMSLRSVTFSNR